MLPPAPFAILALVLGGLAVLRLVRQVSWSPLWASSWPARLALAHLVGSAVMAWVVTVLGLVAGRLLVWPVYCLFAAAAIAGYIRRRAPAQRPGPPQPQRPPERGGFWMWFAMGAVAIAVAVTGWQLAGQRVLAIDAYTMWEKKAKAFYIAGSFTPLLANCCDQVHFPVLWSLQPWWVYKHLHHTDERWMAILGFVFYLDLLALTFSACRAYMRPEWAWTATALVANDPAMSLLVTSGFAEVPLAAYILASSVCLFAYLSLRQQSARIPALLLLLGALQTKNEGFAWAVFGVALAVFFELRWKRPRTAAWTFGLFAIAAAPWMLFKHLHAMKATLDEPLATLPPFGLAWLHRLVAIVPMASPGCRDFKPAVSRDSVPAPDPHQPHPGRHTGAGPARSPGGALLRRLLPGAGRHCRKLCGPRHEPGRPRPAVHQPDRLFPPGIYGPQAPATERSSVAGRSSASAASTPPGHFPPAAAGTSQPTFAGALAVASSVEVGVAR